MCTRDGFSRLILNPDLSPYTNADYHHQGDSRERVTLLYESTDNGGQRRLFAGTQSRVVLLDETMGLWTNIVTGKGSSGSRFKVAQLQDFLLFTNDVDPVFSYQISTGAVANVSQLSNAPWRDAAGASVSGKALTKAKVIIQYQGVLFLMNVFQDGQRFSSRVTWCDLNLPLSWVLNPGASVAGFQDLQYGDEILAAAEMNGALMIYTTRGIYRMVVTADPNSAFGFQRIYSEPKNQSGCLAFPNTLVSDGKNHYYMARDGIYHFNPYLSAPERIDWIHRADGVIYTKLDTKIAAVNCASPVGEFRPIQREVIFSWPSAGAVDNNNWSLALNIDKQTSDVIDHGFTALVNYRPGNSSEDQCNINQLFIGASGYDWTLKQIGGGFFARELLPVSDDLTTDYAANANSLYLTAGYYRILRGLIPTGLLDREKLIDFIGVDNDSVSQDNPCVIRMRVGTSFNVVDPNSTESRCSPLWRRLLDVPIECIDDTTLTAMRAANQRPATAKGFSCFEQGKFLYFEMTITAADGSPAIGADACFSRLDFNVMPLEKV